MIQRCRLCNLDLDAQLFPKSLRGRKGQACSACLVIRARKRNLQALYGLTPEDVDVMRERQHNRCLGCQQELPANFCVDHNHITNKVRGLLCRPCNLVLGLLKEDKGTLTRLRLYLDRDPTKINIYLIGSLRNENVTTIAAGLRDAGFVVWDEWMAAGPTADDSWQKYETEKGHSYPEALTGYAAQNVFYFDKGLIDLADIGIMVMPAGKSGHLELGYMSARGKNTYILQAGAPDRFDVMPQFATGVFDKLEDLIGTLSSQSK